MAVNKHLFRWMYVGPFLRTVEYFERTLNQKVLPSFDSISHEAEQVETEAFERLGKSVDPEWYDPADYFEAARDEGIDFYIMANGMKQGITNLFTAGLFHLFEQWFLKIYRQELVSFREEPKPNLLKLAIALDRLLRGNGIDIQTFSSWRTVDELRLVANTIKHADGASCKELKKLRPDLFVSPLTKDEGVEIDLVVRREVFHPLAGEDLYVSADEFGKYAEAVKHFADELAKAFDTKA